MPYAQWHHGIICMEVLGPVLVYPKRLSSLWPMYHLCLLVSASGSFHDAFEIIESTQEKLLEKLCQKGECGLVKDRPQARLPCCMQQPACFQFTLFW